MQDDEKDDVQLFFDERESSLARKAGLTGNAFIETELSDEEVLGIESDEESGKDDYYGTTDKKIQEKREKTSREQEYNWGDKDNYFGGEEGVGEEQGASEEEEEEAIRLHEQELDEMHDSDFADDDMATWKDGAAEYVPESVEKAVIDPQTLSSDERRKLVSEKFPALVLFGRELTKFSSWETRVNELETEPRQVGLTALKLYKACCLMFFALFNEHVASDFTNLAKLEEHPVNEAILVARQHWVDFERRFLGAKEVDEEDEEADEEDEVDEVQDEEEEVQDIQDVDEVEVDDDDMDDNSESSNSEDEFAIHLKPATKLARTVDDFDEAADTIEQQARLKNKQSLRFYTSQIGKADQKPRVSGDLDLPYAERDFERRQRLMAEAQKRGRETPDVLGEGEVDDEDEVERSAFYASAVAQKQASKTATRELHTQTARAVKEGRFEEYLAANQSVDKRAINYQIQKNKGLTRKRKKENRNARVKKRNKYEDAQKRIKGARRVYTGSPGPYGGESTGIRKNLAHSTRFKS